MIIIIITTLFESQIILAEHECCTNWGDCKSNKSNQIKCWFLRRGENRSSRRKTSRSRVENQQTQSTYMTPVPGIEPGTHRWKASALTTTPTLLPAENSPGSSPGRAHCDTILNKTLLTQWLPPHTC